MISDWKLEGNRFGLNIRNLTGDFPGGLVVRAPSVHCRGHGFDPWSGK